MLVPMSKANKMPTVAIAHPGADLMRRILPPAGLVRPNRQVIDVCNTKTRASTVVLRIATRAEPVQERGV